MNEYFKQSIKQSLFLRRLLALPLSARRAFLMRYYKPRFDVVRTLSAITRSDIDIEVEEFSGIFRINPRSNLLHRVLVYGNYEPVIAKYLFDRLPKTGDVIDVGANIGFYTVGTAKRNKNARVLAIEPTEGAFRRLRHNCEVNEVSDRVILEKCLVSSEAGALEINVIDGQEEYSSIGGPEHPVTRGRAFSTETVACETLDALVAKHLIRPAFVKVDVEGAEMKVFSGASDTLKQFRPLVLAECSDSLLKKQGSSTNEVFDFFHRHNYKVLNPLAPNTRLGKSYDGDIWCEPMYGKE